VYVVRLWVANIGEGVDVLLGMNFMFSAGVRLSTREGLVMLPDEETILMYGGPDRSHMGLDLPVRPTETLYLRPGDSTIVRIRYGQSNPQREVIWAGRGDRWVTKVIYAAKSWPVAIKVVNISDKLTWIDPGTDVARIVEYGFFPQAGRYVRPGKRKYQEWQQLIYESTLSAQAQLRADKLEQLRCAKEPPCVQRPSYPWPSKILLRPDPVTAEVRMARLQVQPKSVRVTPVPNDAECDHVLRWLASAFRRSLSVTTVRMEIALRRLRLALKLRTRM
jgi:hypothetical protein